MASDDYSNPDRDLTPHRLPTRVRTACERCRLHKSRVESSRFVHAYGVVTKSKIHGSVTTKDHVCSVHELALIANSCLQLGTPQAGPEKLLHGSKFSYVS